MGRWALAVVVVVVPVSAVPPMLERSLVCVLVPLWGCDRCRTAAPSPPRLSGRELAGLSGDQPCCEKLDPLAFSTHHITRCIAFDDQITRCTQVNGMRGQEHDSGE